MLGKRPTVFYSEKSVIFLILVIVLLAGNFVYQFKYLRPSDDYFWLMFISNNFVDSDLGQHLYERYGAFVHDSGYSADAVARANAREDLDENYLLQGLFFVPFLLIARELSFSVEAQTVFVMFGGFISMYLATSALLLWALWRCRDATLVVSFVSAISLIYFLDFFSRFAVFHYFHPGVLGVDLMDQVQHLFARLVQPGPQYVAFNFAPKDRLTVLVAVLLLLRWSGRQRTFYLALPFLLLVHREYGGLLLAMFVAIDLLIRPRFILATWVGPFAGLAVGAFIATSALGERAEVSRWLAVVPVALSIAAFLAYHAVERLTPGLLEHRLARLESFASRLAAPARDIVAFGAIWLLLLPLTYWLYTLTGDPRDSTETNLNNFIWLWVPTRYLGLFSLSILAVIIWSLLRLGNVGVLWRGMPADPSARTFSFGLRPWRYLIAALLVVLILIPAARYGLRQGGDPYSVALRKTQELESTLSEPAGPSTWRSDEVKVYYAMFAALLADEDRLGMLGIP